VRANIVCDSAHQLTRIEAFATTADKVMALHAIPALGDFLSDVTCDAMVGAELLEILPTPARSLTATMPWDPEVGVGKTEKKWVRALYALPLLVVVYGCSKTMGPTAGQLIPLVGPSIKRGALHLVPGQATPILSEFFGLKWIDRWLGVYVSVFTPSISGLDPVGRVQGIAFLADLIPIQAIWMIEGIRRGNFTTAAHLL
jgi:hypothetical protein